MYFANARIPEFETTSESGHGKKAEDGPSRRPRVSAWPAYGLLLAALLALKASSASGQMAKDSSGGAGGGRRQGGRGDDGETEETVENCFRSMAVFDNQTGLGDLVNLALQGTDWCVMSKSGSCPPSAPSPGRGGQSDSSGAGATEDANKMNSTVETKVDDDEDTIRVIPLNDAEKPMVITVSFYVEDINTINEVDMDYRLDYYIEQVWKTNKNYCKSYEASLVKRSISLSAKGGPSKLGVKLKSDYFNLFWLPDLFVTNAKSVSQQSKVFDTRSLNIRTEFIENSTTDSRCVMTLTARFVATVSCPMEFKKYPVDTQTCPVKLRSFAYGAENVVLHWGRVLENKELVLLEHTYTLNWTNASVEVFQSNYSLLVITLRLKRDIANKLAGVFVPSLLIVIITFTTFWLGPSSLSDRVSIGITAFLAVVTQFAQTRVQLPPISYVSEIDKWMLLCMTFVAIQLFQATIMHYTFEAAKLLAEKRHRVVEAASRLKERIVSGLSSRMSAHDEAGGLRNRKEAVTSTKDSLDRSEQSTEDGKPRAMVTAATATLSEQLKRDGQFRDHDEEQAEFEMGDCCRPCIALFEVQVPKTNPAHAPLRMDAFSRVFIPLAFFAFCAYYWPTLLKNA